MVQVQLLHREKEDVPPLTNDGENIKEIEDESKGPELMKLVDSKKTETEKEEVEDGKSYDVHVCILSNVFVIIIDVHIFFMITIMFILH